MKAKDWLLFIGALILALIIYGIEHFEKPSWLDLSLGKYSGAYNIKTEEKEFDLSKASTLIIEDNRGSISLNGENSSTMKLKWEKIIYEKDRDSAEEIAKNIKLMLKEQENVFHLFTNSSEMENKFGRGIKNNFYIYVPRSIKIIIKNKMGDVQVSDIDKEIKVDNSYGKTIIKNCAYIVLVNQNFGEIELENDEGPIVINSKFSRIDLKDVGGTVSIEGNYLKIFSYNIKGLLNLEMSYGMVESKSILGGLFAKIKHTALFVDKGKEDFKIDAAFADIDLKNIENRVDIISKHSYIKLEDIKGEAYITASFKDVILREMRGWCKIEGKHSLIKGQKLENGANIVNTFEDINLEEIYGKVFIKNNHSDVIIKNTEKKYSEFIINTRYGDIDLEIPEIKAMKIEASVYKGDIENQFGGDLFIQEQRDDYFKIKSKEKEGLNGFINLNSEYGNIALRKSFPAQK